MREYIRELKQRLHTENITYFQALEDGSFSREDFVETQIQFLFAVVFFSRPMAVMAARLPRPEQRLDILENVYEEHGEGKLSMSHEKTFLTLLDAFGVSREEMDARALWPEVRAFNTCLTGLSAHDDVYTAISAMGMIEDLFAGFSARLGQGILSRGWLTKEELIHYGTHETLDEEHCDEFYRVVEPLYGNPRHCYQIQQGLELGAYIFVQLYKGLYAARERRWQRDVRGPHSLADGWYVSETF